jgi:signal transduction histidine kinase
VLGKGIHAYQKPISFFSSLCIFFVIRYQISNAPNFGYGPIQNQLVLYTLLIQLVSLVLTIIQLGFDLPNQVMAVLSGLKIGLIYMFMIPLRGYPLIGMTLVIQLLIESYVLWNLFIGVLLGMGALGSFTWLPSPQFIWGFTAPVPENHMVRMVQIYSFIFFFVFSMSKIVFDKLSKTTLLLHQQTDALQEVYRANVEFQEYTVKLERDLMVDERKRITREIHDTMGYTLTTLRMLFEAGAILIDQDIEKLRTLLQKASKQLEMSQADIRKSLRNLRHVENTSYSLHKRLKALAQHFSSATSVTVDLDFSNCQRKLPTEIQDIFYKGMQEGLTNSFLHGKASVISVILQDLPNKTVLIIIDNGIGAKNIQHGIGFLGMTERLNPYNGNIWLENLNPGFKLSIEIPIQLQDVP